MNFLTKILNKQSNSSRDPDLVNYASVSLELTSEKEFDSEQHIFTEYNRNNQFTVTYNYDTFEVILEYLPTNQKRILINTLKNGWNAGAIENIAGLSVFSLMLYNCVIHTPLGQLYSLERGDLLEVPLLTYFQQKLLVVHLGRGEVKRLVDLKNLFNGVDFYEYVCSMKTEPLETSGFQNLLTR